MIDKILRGPRPHAPGVAADAGGSGHRVIDRRVFILGLGAILAAHRRGAAGTQGAVCWRC